MSSSIASNSSSAPLGGSSAEEKGSMGGWLPLLLVLFVGSGCAALMYEVVWFQLLQLVIGASAYSIGVLLGTFMGGMCLGSLLFSRFVPRRLNPLKVYACLELSIGLVAILITVGMPLFDYLYIAVAAPGGNAVALRAFVCALCLLPPTMLMGATLPAIARWVEATPRGMSWLGFFYGGNTVGAVLGCLISGFFLLRYFDMTTATYIAAGINLTVACMAFGMSAGLEYTPAAEKASAGTEIPSGAVSGAIGNGFVYLTIALSGMAALGAEVVWTRILSLVLGATTYTFSIILAVFLIGLGVGSSGGALFMQIFGGKNGVGRARTALGWCQIGCVLGVAWTAYAVTNGLPTWNLANARLHDGSVNYWFDLKRCMWATWPATIFWGASFPLALSAVRTAGRDPARMVGRVYAANTLGAIVGAPAFALFFIKWYQTPNCEHILIGIAGVSAAVAVLPGLLGLSADGTTVRFGSRMMLIPQLALAVIAPIVAVHVLTEQRLDLVPWRMVAWGKDMGFMGIGDENLYMGEGMNSSVAVSRTSDGVRQFHVSGKCEASTMAVDMRLQYMLGHYPALFHPHPKSVLIVGCGAGVTAGSFILHPEIERIVICEIEPLVPQVVAQYFAEENNGVAQQDPKLKDPRVEIVYDDARHFILTTKEKFDIITSDPIHPWVKGAATLYTKEYFELVKSHLNPGGLVTQWVPLYQSSEQTVKSEVCTFFNVFPQGVIWSNPDFESGYDTITMGGDAALKIDMAQLQARIDKLPVAAQKLGAAFVGPGEMVRAMDILKTYAGAATEMKGWTEAADAQINFDRNLRLQYLAGDSLNSDNGVATKTLNDILSYRHYPREMLKSSRTEEMELREAFGVFDR